MRNSIIKINKFISESLHYLNTRGIGPNKGNEPKKVIKKDVSQKKKHSKQAKFVLLSKKN